MRYIRKRIVSTLIILSILFSFTYEPILAKAAGISLNKTSIKVGVGRTTELQVKGTSKTATWKVKDSSVAKVNKKGIVTGLDEGTTTITVTVNKKVLTCKVTVALVDGAKEVSSITGGKLTDQDIQSLIKASADTIQEKISTVEDLVKYMQKSGFYYYEKEGFVKDYWTWGHSGNTVIDNNYGICCDIANMASYVLKDDYDDLGFIWVAGYGVGHIFNYVKTNNKYYIFDLTNVSYDIHNNTVYFEADSLLDFQKAIYNYMGSGGLGLVIAYPSHGFDAPAQYISNMKGGSLKNVTYGLASNVKATIIYNDPLDRLNFKYIDSISNGVPSYSY